VEVTALLKSGGTHLPGVVNPTQLARFLDLWSNRQLGERRHVERSHWLSFLLFSVLIEREGRKLKLKIENSPLRSYYFCCC
jgi:hypothetical protein